MSRTPSHVTAFNLGEARIEDLLAALDAGGLTSVELTVLHLNRIFAYDRSGPRLNSVPVLNPDALAEAAASDARRAAGAPLGALEGIPYTVKDSYKVRGMTVACGSPAFASLRADEDAFTVARLRDAGAVLIGKTNMAPLADGGLQRGLYGRAESPYNGAYLTAAWNSGSSNGSGTATSAVFASFSMGEETVSSGRSPASNNGLVVYTPSRGLISVRGNWPLRPLRDVIAPMARNLDDLFRVLDVIVVPDPDPSGDLWRRQPFVSLPRPETVRPPTYAALADSGALRGRRIGVPTVYIGKDPRGRKLAIRPSILELWTRAVRDLEALGATVVEIDFPLHHDYEQDCPDAVSPAARGLIPEAWWHVFGSGVLSSSRLEKVMLSACAWQEFLAGCHDRTITSWSDIETASVFPYPPGSIDYRRKGPFDPAWADIGAAVAAGLPPYEKLPGIADAIRGLEAIRKVDFEQWLSAHSLDFLAFPANGDVSRASADTDEADNAFATSPGVATSNGGGMIRHLGIPTVSVPMGLAADLEMPVNLTLAGPAYSDNSLLASAWAYERASRRRPSPPRTPPLFGESIELHAERERPAPLRAGGELKIVLAASLRTPGGEAEPYLEITGTVTSSNALARVDLYLNGRRIGGSLGDAWIQTLPMQLLRDDTGALPEVAYIVVFAKDDLGAAAASLTQVDLTLS